MSASSRERVTKEALEYTFKEENRNKLRFFPEHHASDDNYYNGEKGNINPGYYNLTRERGGQCLTYGSNRIWIIRSDGEVVTGVKRQSRNNIRKQTRMPKSMVEELSDLRFGHPTLALSEENYDGGVLLAGWVVQRNGYLHVHLHSGRYKTENSLTKEERKILKLYVASAFMQSFGLQLIAFTEYSQITSAGAIISKCKFFLPKDVDWLKPKDINKLPKMLEKYSKKQEQESESEQQQENEPEQNQKSKSLFRRIFK